MTHYRFTSAARSELRQAIEYYEERENGLGASFLNEIENTIESNSSEPKCMESAISTNTTLPNPPLPVRFNLSDSD